MFGLNCYQTEETEENYFLLLTKQISYSILVFVRAVRKFGQMYARVAQLVEHDLAKVGVAGSSPVSRSNGKQP